MRRLAEGGFVVGFDGPKLHLAKPDGELRAAAVELMLRAVQLPRAPPAASGGAAPPEEAPATSSRWAAMSDAERARHEQVAKALAVGVVAEARKVFG